MADSNNPGIEVYLLVAYRPRNTSTMRILSTQRVKRLRDRLKLDITSALCKELEDKSVSYLALNDADGRTASKLMFVGSDNHLYPHRCMTEPISMSAPIQSDKRLIAGVVFEERKMMVIFSNEMMFVFQDSIEVFNPGACSQIKNKRTFDIKSRLLDGRYTNYGKFATLLGETLVFLNTENQLVSIGLQQFDGTSQPHWASCPLEYQVFDGPFADFYPIGRKLVCTLANDGDIETVNLVTSKKTKHTGYSLKMNSSSSQYFTTIVRSSISKNLIVASVEAHFYISSISFIVLPRHSKKAWKRTPFVQGHISRDPVFQMLLVRCTGKLELLIAGQVFNYLHLYVVDGCRLHVLKEFIKYDDRRNTGLSLDGGLESHMKKLLLR